LQQEKKKSYAGYDNGAIVTPTWQLQVTDFMILLVGSWGWSFSWF
jgi:hypothetical protein